MLRRTAALYDRDPRELEATAEILALRGVHPTIDAPRSALLEAHDVPSPRSRPSAGRYAHGYAPATSG